MKEHVTVNTEFSILRYGNFGIGVSSNYYPFLKYKISPFIGITSTRTFGVDESFEEGKLNGRYLVFHISTATYLTPFLGIKYDTGGLYNGNGELSHNVFSVFFKLGYKFTISGSPVVTQISVTDTNNRTTKINRYVDDKFAFGFGFFYCW